MKSTQNSRFFWPEALHKMRVVVKLQRQKARRESKRGRSFLAWYLRVALGITKIHYSVFGLLSTFSFL